MNDDFKGFFKSLVTSYLKKGIIIVLIILSITIVLAGSYYIIDDDAFKKAASASEQYKETVSVSPTQGITSTLDKTSPGTGDNKYNSELLQFFEDNGYDVEKYFNDKDDEKNLKNFKKLLNAEIVTQYPYIEGLDDDLVNGVVRFKRIEVSEEVDNDDFNQGNISNDISDVLQGCLKFESEEDFMGWIDEYNQNVEDPENNLEKIMNSFTLTADNEKVVIAVLKQAKVETNDYSKTVDELREELDETFKGANYIQTSQDGKLIYTFKVADILEINYKDLIEKYTMPSNFLFTLLTYSEDLDFTLKIAELAYNSTIVVGIYDANSDIETLVKEYTYNKQKKEEYSANIYVPAVLGGYEYEEQEVGNNFETFGESILSQYQDAIDRPQDEYSEYFNVIKENIYNIDYDNGNYTDNLNLSFEYLLDENGSVAVDTVPKEYFMKYTFYANEPKTDINIADIWYGYYRNDYYYNKPELIEGEPEKIEPSDYDDPEELEWNDESRPEPELLGNITDLFSGSIENYVDSGAFKDFIESEFERKFDDGFDKWFEEKHGQTFNAWCQAEWENNKGIFNNFLKYKSDKKIQKQKEYKDSNWDTYYARMGHLLY